MLISSGMSGGIDMESITILSIGWMDALLEWFDEWSFCYFIDCPYEDRYPSDEQVRLVVYRC